MTLMIQQMLAQKHAVTSSSETLTLSRKARRLFLGNIPSGMGLTDTQITEFFNMATRESGIALMPGDPVIASWLSPEGKYGFIEFRCIDECTAAMALNGISLQGRQLVIKRPNDYEPAPPGIPTGVALTQNSNATSATLGESNLSALGAAMPAMPGVAAPPVPSIPPTSVLMLTNMVTAEELEDDQFRGYRS